MGWFSKSEKSRKGQDCATCGRPYSWSTSSSLEGVAVCTYCKIALEKVIKKGRTPDDILLSAQESLADTRSADDALLDTLTFLANLETDKDLYDELRTEWDRIIRADQKAFDSSLKSLADIYLAALYDKFRDTAGTSAIARALNSWDNYYPSYLSSQVVHIELSALLSVADSALRIVQGHLEALLKKRQAILGILKNKDVSFAELNDELAVSETKRTFNWDPFPFSSETITTTLACTPENLIAESERLAPDCAYRTACLAHIQKLRSRMAAESEQQ
ncbi:hypothetical protein KQH82_05180 [bacterium]|nr:hypothetical protein [bacterium]